MRSYVEITLLPNADIALYFLWQKVYQQVHLALVEIQKNDKRVKIGVSFPEYNNDKFQLGSKLRILADSSEELDALNLTFWLSRLSDYVHHTSIRPIPTNITEYAFFKRQQHKSNNTRLARRKAKREGICLDEAISYYEQWKETYSRAPFIRIKSLSTEEYYRLFIVKELTKTKDKSNGFSTYGLSSQHAKSAVPLF